MERSGLLLPGGEGLQALVEQAAKAFGTPMAAISVIDRHRQWFKARVGLAVSETSRDVSFCAHAIHQPGEALVVPDASEDRRFAGNPLVTGAPFIRFYAGMPLVDQSGYALGALCVLDAAPRPQGINMFDLLELARRAERLIGG
ncbi:GAF domain-containing protein [Sphingomonas morindae]|uniref:GAF domain-containing protein n=1 Tax=Sphingomonas morindae TaxID=1541170 RepID=A0ABY4XCB4_9SPHN|nr:GAF domain-containing protein [Sphingomonas morindae]USI74608.1 GAF domain-containing protein [Sphingomonas morindae]